MKFKDLAFLFEEAEGFGEWILAVVIAILIFLVYMAIVGAIVVFMSMSNPPERSKSSNDNDDNQ